MTVSLPDKGDGSRRQRREEHRRKASRSGVRIAAAAVAVAMVGALVWTVVGLVADDGGGGATPDLVEVPTTADGPGPALLVLLDEAGDVYGLTIFEPETAAIVHVPPGTLVEAPSLGLTSLRDAAREADVVLLQQSLENLLGVRFDESRTLDPTALGAVVEPLGSLSVVVDEAVEDRTADSRVTVVVPEGANAVTASTVVSFLASVGDATSLDRLVRHQRFWSAYLEADGIEPPLDAIAALADETTVQQRVLPVESVAGLTGDEELYRVVDDDVVAMVGRLFPNAPLGGAGRIRVRILNGAGAPGIAQQVQPLLLDAGGKMTLSGNADRFDYEVTQIVFYDDAKLDDARSIRDALGVGEVVKSLTGLAAVDVTVVVGADFLAARPGG